MNAMWFKLFSQLYCGGVADGRMDRDNGARLCIRRQLGDDLAHLRVIEDGHTDDVGSRNVGATNVARSFGKLPGIIALLLDMAKGYVAVALATWVTTSPNWPLPSRWCRMRPLTTVSASCGTP